jgi:cell division transport system ATP-binding protein
VISFSSVFKAYAKGTGGLRDVSLQVRKGEFVFLTGHSGAGKSTMLKLMYADQRPTNGSVKVAGFEIGELVPADIPRLRRKLGIVFQDFQLLDDRTAHENVAFALEVTGAPADTIGGKVMRVLTQVGLAAKAGAYPRELSGGEQQRVAIARALVNDPPILLADEPTGNLDERATRGVFQLLRDINAGGTCVVMATHDLDLVKAANYRSVELRGGEIVYDSADGAGGSDESDGGGR